MATIISCSSSVVAQPIAAEKIKKFEANLLDNPANFLNEFIVRENIDIRKEVTLLPAKEETDRKGEIHRKGAIASAQLYKGFINLTDTGSIYYRNNNKNYAIGYVKIDEENNSYEFVIKNDDLLNSIATIKTVD